MWPRAWQPLRWQPEGAPGNDETTIANISVQKKWIWFNDTWWYMYKFILYHFECTYEYIYAYIHAVYCVSIYIYIDFYIPYAGPILLNYTGYIQLSYVDTSWYIGTSQEQSQQSPEPTMFPGIIALDFEHILVSTNLIMSMIQWYTVHQSVLKNFKIELILARGHADISMCRRQRRMLMKPHQNV